ncbi:MAG: threonine synthase [Prevotella sp.]|nr:threonine synthase [Prevotella sp.]
MKYYSTNGKSAPATLEEAVVRGLAPDRGLYMPERIHTLPQEFFDDIQDMPFRDVAYNVAEAFFGEDISGDALYDIVCDALNFDTPVVELGGNIFTLELFHGPTLAFKDVGARFMARMLQYFLRRKRGNVKVCANESTNLFDTECSQSSTIVNVLVATSGDTGSAVANGFLGVEGIHVYVLYPKGKVSAIQECQFTTLGRNITAIEVDGVFDDCQALVKSAFMDADLQRLNLTSANSINVARFLPQAFYYFHAYGQLKKRFGRLDNLVVSVPSGNFGNICSALFARRMGLPIKRFIAANNANDVFYNYLQTGEYVPKPSVQTIANAMDVGDPSNFARVCELYGKSHAAICRDISGATYTDEEIARAMKDCFARYNYICDPHGACGYQSLRDSLAADEIGVFLETAHPAKFKATVDSILHTDIPIPEKLQAFMRGTKQSVPMSTSFADFKAFLLSKHSV